MASFTMHSFRFFLLCVAFLASACSARAPGNGDPDRITNFTGCVLPKDQGQGSLQGAWSSLPIPIVFDKDFYVTDQGEAMPALRNAVNTWNNWAGMRGMQAFSIRLDGSDSTAGMEIPEITECVQEAYSSSVTDMVGIWKIATSGFHRNRRPSCLTQQKILPDGIQGQTAWVSRGRSIVGASVLLNFENYNAPGKQLVDVESLMLHELGHVLGLLHSCKSGDSDQTSSPYCDAAASKYRDAVMYPGLATAQERRSLRQNDYNRVNCLY